MNKQESKYFNTASYMDEALLVLLEKKDYNFITVKEVCQKAGVNRSTFYLHYEKMDDLLEETVNYVNNKFMDKLSLIGEVEVQCSNLTYSKSITGRHYCSKGLVASICTDGQRKLSSNGDTEWLNCHVEISAFISGNGRATSYSKSSGS